MALAGDARLALEALADALAREPGKCYEAERCGTAETAVEAKAAFADEVDRECEAATAVPLQSKRIVHELNGVFGRDTILVNENGGQDLWTYFHPDFRVLDVGDVVLSLASRPAWEPASPARSAPSWLGPTRRWCA